MEKDNLKILVKDFFNYKDLEIPKTFDMDFEIAYDNINDIPKKYECYWSMVDLTDIEEELKYKPTECGMFSDDDKKKIIEEDLGNSYEKEAHDYYGNPLYKEEYDNSLDEYSIAEHLVDDGVFFAPIFKKVNSYDLQNYEYIDKNSINTIADIIKKLNEHKKIDWFHKLNNPEIISKEKGSDHCPKSCKIISLEHGTSLKRAENIRDNGFFEIVREKESDLEKRKIGYDMREGYGGIGEIGVTYFFRKGHGQPLKHHGVRVAKIDQHIPAVIEMDACVCNYVEPYDTVQSNFISSLEEISQNKSTIHNQDDHSFDVRYYSIKKNFSPVSVFQRLSTENTTMGDLMDSFNIDGMDENNSVVILRDPNRSLIPSSFRIRIF